MKKKHRPIDISILWRDDWVLAVNKPAGVLSVPGRGTAPTVTEILREAGQLSLEDEIRFVHRLDLWASGVMLLARSKTAQRNLTASWSTDAVEKVYLALVHGRLEGGGEIDVPLFVDRDRGRVCVDPRRGKRSVTLYKSLECLAADRFTLVECCPLTGRLHQIRVHLASIGHPLAVDPRYGTKKELFLSEFKRDYRSSRRHEERPLIARLTLHAARLTCPHPESGEIMAFEAPPPKDFRAALQQLRRLAESPK